MYWHACTNKGVGFQDPHCATAIDGEGIMTASEKCLRASKCSVKTVLGGRDCVDFVTEVGHLKGCSAKKWVFLKLWFLGCWVQGWWVYLCWRQSVWPAVVCHRTRLVPQIIFWGKYLNFVCLLPADDAGGFFGAAGSPGSNWDYCNPNCFPFETLEEFPFANGVQ